MTCNARPEAGQKASRSRTGVLLPMTRIEPSGAALTTSLTTRAPERGSPSMLRVARSEAIASARAKLSLQGERAGRAGSWSSLAWDGAGWSLGGRPLPCGATVELQEVSGTFDEYGSYHRALQAGTPVQFYLPEERRDRPLLRRLVGGHKFSACYEPWMRFRWPQGPQGGGR